MSDFDISGQATQAFQNAQAQSKISLGKKPDQKDDNSFAALAAKQIRDPSYTDAMQKRKLRETAVDFEAQFLSQMLQPMFEGIEADGPFGGGSGEKMWQSMLVQEYGKSLSQNGGIGLADEVQKQLLRMQEGIK
jgi:peptidoglycan hydrolase FlgJ